MKNPEKKFSKLYDKNVDKIYRFIYLKVESSDIAEDLTGQVFAKAWDRFKNSDSDKKDEIRNPRAYIYQIARSEIAGHHRNKPDYKVISTEANYVPAEDPAPSPEENQIMEADLRLLREAIKDLKEDYQNAVIWRYLEGYSYKKVAELMERPENTVRVMVHRALAQLQEKMEEFGRN